MQLSVQHIYILLIAFGFFIGGLSIYIFMFRSQKNMSSLFNSELNNHLQQYSEVNESLHSSQTELALSKQKNDDLNVLLAQSSQKIDLLQKQNSSLQLDLQQSNNDVISLKADQIRERSHTQEKLEQIELTKSQLKKDFESLAQEIMKTSQKEFSSQSKEGLELFLSPFRQQISDFKEKVESIHTNDLQQRAALKTELKNLQSLNQQMTEEAHQLSTALKGQKKTQGNWGELILENVLDRSGLQANTDYKREVSFNTEEGKRRPDVIVYLPENKQLIIDAKVSLNAYTRYINAGTEIEKSEALKQHVNAISDRIKDLSSKNYFDLPGIKSPEMVFMFIPIESAFVEAIRADESLFQLAIDQQVLVTTPTTLLTSLNIIRQLWRFEDQNKHSAKLADQAGKVYNQLRLFMESMESLGVQLDKSRKTYDTAMKQFVSGKGNLVKRVEDFQKLGVSVKKEMPKDVVERASLELDVIDHPSDVVAQNQSD